MIVGNFVAATRYLLPMDLVENSKTRQSWRQISQEDSGMNKSIPPALCTWRAVVRVREGRGREAETDADTMV